MVADSATGRGSSVRRMRPGPADVRQDKLRDHLMIPHNHPFGTRDCPTIATIEAIGAGRGCAPIPHSGLRDRANMLNAFYVLCVLANAVRRNACLLCGI